MRHDGDPKLSIKEFKLILFLLLIEPYLHEFLAVDVCDSPEVGGIKVNISRADRLGLNGETMSTNGATSFIIKWQHDCNARK